MTIKFNNSAICPVCLKPKTIPGKSGKQFHPACSKKLQEANKDKKRIKAPKKLEERDINGILKRFGI